MKINREASKEWFLSEAPFPFQQTYVTALADLPKFVDAILKPFTFLNGAVWIELIVFEPRELIWYLRGRGIVCDQGELNQAVLTAESRAETAELLECVFGQWTDFAFIPSPKNFAIYADHDEYTTIFAPSAETLASLQLGMKAQGYKAVEDWVWTEISLATQRRKRNKCLILNNPQKCVRAPPQQQTRRGAASAGHNTHNN